MGRKPRTRPQRLPAKLLAIRRALGLSQPQMAKRLEVPDKRVSEYETGRREPNLTLVLRYAQAGRISVESLIDDELELPL